MSNLSVSLLSGVFGFLGVVYELTLAQTFSLLFGSSILQYSLTFGTFLCGLGMGAEWIGRRGVSRLILVRLQVTLALGGPILTLCIWSLAVSDFTNLAHALGLLTALLVGILTGGELPLLLRWSSRPLLVLAADYFGMLLACLAFPLVLLPEFGVLLSLFLAAIGNALTLFVLAERKHFRVASLVIVLILVALLEPTLRAHFSERLAP